VLDRFGGNLSYSLGLPTGFHLTLLRCQGCRVKVRV
jgi:hypothetical protein